MVVGFNHNFTYKGVVYHIQTEDSGRNSPTIVTLLYHGGTILASRKTSYADIVRVENLEQVVEELMKEQHKGMLRSLKNGEFDDAIDRHARGAPAPSPAVTAAVSPPAVPPVRPPVAASPPAAPHPAAPSVAAAVPPRPPAATPPPAAKPASGETSLDEIILSYLMGKDK
jgi:uncharacterized membrane protein